MLFRPDWLFLDEASSALDEATEADCSRALKRHLPHATLISIAHKPGVLSIHDARISIDPRLGIVNPTELRTAVNLIKAYPPTSGWISIL